MNTKWQAPKSLKEIIEQKQFKNRSLFQYEFEGKEGRSIAGPANAEQVLKDWNRNSALFFINGKSVKELVNDKVPAFDDTEALSKFFDQYLLQKVTDERQKNALRAQYLTQLHQAGVPFATNMINFKNIADNLIPGGIYLQQPEPRVDFMPQKDGLFTRETNEYKAILNESAEKISPADGTYYAKTVTDTKLTASGVELRDLTVSCKDNRVAPAFDQRTLVQKLQDFIKSLLNLNAIKSLPGEGNKLEEKKSDSFRP